MNIETMIGLQFRCGAEQRHFEQCSQVVRGMLQYLTRDCGVSFNQILYPCADMLSLSERAGAEGTRLFDSRLLLRNIGLTDPQLRQALAHGIACAEERGAHRQDIEALLPMQGVTFCLTDGNAAAQDIAAFLAGDSQNLMTAGDFGMQLSGFLPHWRIREEAKKFASFCEMAYRRSKGNVCGLSGGRLVLCENDGSVDVLQEIFFQKTGCRAGAIYHA